MIKDNPLHKVVTDYSKQREVHTMALLAIDKLINTAPGKLTILPSKENAEKNTAEWLQRFNHAFLDQSTNTLHTKAVRTINTAIDQFKKPEEVKTLQELKALIELSFAQIQKIFATPNLTRIDPTTMRNILERSSILVMQKDGDPKLFTRRKKYLQLLTTVLQTINEIQQLNLIMQDLHKPESSARVHIQKLYGLYTQYLIDLNNTLSQIKTSAKDPTLDQTTLKDQLDNLKAQIKPANLFAKQCLTQETTPENTALTPLFFELLHKNMEEFNQDLLKEIANVWEVKSSPRLITFFSIGSSGSTLSSDSEEFKKFMSSPPPSPHKP